MSSVSVGAGVGAGAWVRRAVCWLGVALLIAGCSSGPAKPKPTPLETVSPKLTARQLWKLDVGGWKFPMRMAVAGDTVVVAANDGRITAVGAADGRTRWTGTVGDKLSAGVGSDGRYASVVTVDNEVVVLDAGKPLWRARLGTSVVTPPLVAGERVFVVGVDRSVQAFDVLDGRRLWSYQHNGDPLSLLQPGVLMPFKDTLVAGQGPKLVGLDPLRGTLRWEVTMASPRGTNELERLADLVGPAARIGDAVCARGFQVAVACANADRGVLSWSKNLAGSTGVGADGRFVYAVDINDRVIAYKQDSGEVAWASDRLLYRALGAPLVTEQALVVGDFEGQLHFLDRSTGDTLLRMPTDGKPPFGAPVRAGAVIVTATDGGDVFAFRIE